MSTPLNTANRWAVLGVAVALTTGVSLVTEQTPALALVNESASLPRGVYVLTPTGKPRREAVVAIAQPPSVRPYLSGLGMPDKVLLIKRVAAVGGDRICRRGKHVSTPGRRVRAREADRRGVPLPRWEGCRRLGPDELFLLGDSGASFDSRYFGAIRRDQVLGVYREALTW